MRKVLLLFCCALFVCSSTIYGQTEDKSSHNLGNDSITIKRQIASNYAKEGLFEKAISLETEIAKYCQMNNMTDEYVICISLIAAYHYDNGEYEQALKKGKQALLYIDNDTVKISNEVRYEIIQHIAIFYEHIGNHEEALKYGNQAISISEQLRDNKYSYPESLTFISYVYSELGDYQRAINLCNKAKILYEQNALTESEDYLMIFNDLGAYYCGNGDVKKAISYANLCVRELKLRGLLNHQSYVVALNNLARYYAIDKNSKEAIKLSKDALDIVNQYIPSNYFLAGRIQEHLSTFYANVGDYALAKKYIEDALSSFSKVWAKDRPGIVTEFRKHLNLLFLCDSISNYEHEIIDIEKSVKNIVLTAFSYLPNSGRKEYWDNYYCSWFFNEFPQYVNSIRSDSLIKEGYNAVLFSKGILLNTEIGVKQLLESTHNQELIQRFYRLQEYKTSLISNDTHQINDSTSWSVNDEEMGIISSCKEYGNNIKRLRVNWKDVQAILSDKDIALEFFDFSSQNGDNIYIVYTLKKGYSCPHYYLLCTEDDLNRSNLYDISKLIWEPLTDELVNVNHIYFSPTGFLHKIGIEYAPGMESYEMFRISSTREIIDLKAPLINTEEWSASLYGGIDYESSNPMDYQDSKIVADVSLKNSISRHRAMIDSLDLRGIQIDYLPGTLREVQNIEKTFTNKHINVTSYTGTKATETSVKSLSGKSPDILHISTHGFYYTEVQAKKKENLRFLSFDDRHHTYNEDKTLTRSGLLMAGAKTTIEGRDVTMDSDDGILTAQEISMLDLRGTDLVVLSACETARGDIMQGEGVFGLQRGFKKAGVKSILMSLWKVSDVSTEMLMTEFYKNFCEGKSKRESLRLAQKAVREYKDDEGNLLFQDPHYWAGFIMLD